MNTTSHTTETTTPATNPATEQIIDRIMREHAATTDPQRRADLIFAALGYRLGHAAQIALAPTDDDGFEVEATLTAAGKVLEYRPVDDCLATHLQIPETDPDSYGEDDEPEWTLPEFFHPLWLPSPDRVAAGLASIGNVLTFRAATADLRALWAA
ncbi:hypothetical protein [Kribbella solani]|uniref:Uncharacterized protein n=1 Tax=Kribbella solani TaxID=236067 RepID=A0A841E4K9_9ACTN|nr:hypothetical protein [Kribbella solani]MBB5983986.1 hypothetical protein [Kribbella solani]